MSADKTPEALDALIPPHPEPHSHRWSDLERAAIREALRRQHQRIAVLEKGLQRIGAIDCSEADKTTAIEMRDIARALISTTQQEDSQA